MRRLFLLIFFIIALGYIFFIRQREKPSSPIVQSTPSPAVSSKKNTVVPINNRTLFVPYWTLENTPAIDGYNSFIYFGISPTLDGINSLSTGYSDIPAFTNRVLPNKSLLTVQMTDEEVNEKVLDSQSVQNRIISDSLTAVQQFGFRGIVLDFEIRGIGFNSLTKQVTDFITKFASQTKKQQRYFAVTVYGDTFYRARPYDIQTIANDADEIIVMAYDFHKAGGDPGPNFPFTESDVDDYSFQQMVDDFQQHVSSNKLTITFGMFGYDWPVSDNGSSITTASPISLSAITKSFIDSCTFTSCMLRRNASSEPSIAYTDTTGQKHLIWFEDEKSVDKKIRYLQTKGISSVAFWANSYF